MKILLMYCFNFSSSGFSFNSSSFVLNTLPLNEKIPFSKKPIMFFLTRNNSSADFKAVFFSFFIFCFVVI